VEKIDISASTGVHSGQDAIKQVLAGAESVQVCSTLYKNGLRKLNEIITDFSKWMEIHGFDSIDEFKGKLSYKKLSDPVIYERSQFMRHFSSIQ
jgi:dihydroorotate dehydrogenase (fumarate)